MWEVEEAHREGAVISKAISTPLCGLNAKKKVEEAPVPMVLIISL